MDPYSQSKPFWHLQALQKQLNKHTITWRPNYSCDLLRLPQVRGSKSCKCDLKEERAALKTVCSKTLKHRTYFLWAFMACISALNLPRQYTVAAAFSSQDFFSARYSLFILLYPQRHACNCTLASTGVSGTNLFYFLTFSTADLLQHKIMSNDFTTFLCTYQCSIKFKV